jgi:hypothetical protein
MRGKFVRSDKINGTMTAFFDESDERSPTGFDSWTFAFGGNRASSGTPGGSN